MNLLRKTELLLILNIWCREKCNTEMALELNLTRKNICLDRSNLLLDKRFKSLINLTWSSTPCRKKWTIWFMSMNKLVKVVTIWVFNWLIAMMSFVFCTKSPIFKKIFLRLVNKKFGRKKRKFVWLNSNWKTVRDNLRSFTIWFLKCLNYLQSLFNRRIRLIKLKWTLNSLVGILRILNALISARDVTWRVKILTRKLLMPKLRFLKNVLTTRRKLFLKKSLFMKKYLIWPRNYARKLWKVVKPLWKLLRKSMSTKRVLMIYHAKCLLPFLNFLCSSLKH